MRKEVENITRLNILLNTSARNALKHVLLKQFSSNTKEFIVHLKKPSTKRKLEKCKQRGVISKQQWLKLYPEHEDKDVDMNKFDHKLTVTLIQKLCDHIKPSKGWKEIPAKLQDNVAEDVVRLKLINEEVEDLREMKDDSFEVKWSKIKEILLRFNHSQNGINNLKTCCVDNRKGCRYFWYHLSNMTDVCQQKLILAALILLCGIAFMDAIKDVVMMAYQGIIKYI